MYILVYIPCVVLVTVNDIHGHSSQQDTKPNASGRTLGTATSGHNGDNSLSQAFKDVC